MRFTILLAMMIASSAGVSSAVPFLNYYPDTGRLLLRVNEPLDLISIGSSGRGLVTPLRNLVPGAVQDASDIPDFLTFLNVPIGYFDLGRRIAPNAALNDLSFRYVAELGIDRMEDGYVVIPLAPEPPSFEVPEPSAIGMATLVIAGASALRRRKGPAACAQRGASN